MNLLIRTKVEIYLKMFVNGELSHIGIWVHGLVTYKYSDSTVVRTSVSLWNTTVTVHTIVLSLTSFRSKRFLSWKFISLYDLFKKNHLNSKNYWLFLFKRERNSLT